MPTLVVLATSDDRLSEAWERQVSSGRTLFRLGRQDFPVTTVSGIAAVVILDTGADALLPSLFVRCPTILIGEPGRRASKAGQEFISPMRRVQPDWESFFH